MVDGKYKYSKMSALQWNFSSWPNFLISFTFEHFSLQYDDRNSISHSDKLKYIAETGLWVT